jgi:AcrR family transcriptional regulator
MDDVALACGVTKLIVYRHFESKEELYHQILQQVFEGLRQELRIELADSSVTGLGPRTLLVVARRDPDAFTLPWRHAAREPRFSAYAAELRRIAVDVVRRLTAIETGDPVFDAWRAESLFGWLIESTLTWLENGLPERDDEFVEQASMGLKSLRLQFTRSPAR